MSNADTLPSTCSPGQQLDNLLELTRQGQEASSEERHKAIQTWFDQACRVMPVAVAQAMLEVEEAIYQTC